MFFVIPSFFSVTLKNTASYFAKLDSFSLRGPDGIKLPFPTQFSLSKHTISKP